MALLARRSDALECVEADIRAAGGQAWSWVHDVTDFDAVPELFDEIVGTLGGLDALFYAAGVMPELDEHEYAFSKDRAMIEVNVLGAMAWFNPAAALMEAQRSGTLVGISSIAGERGRRGNPAYCTSKAALSTYLEAMRNRLSRYGVDVVTVKPGFVDTAMTQGMGDLLWMIGPDEAARQVIELARREGGADAFVPRRWGAVAMVVRTIPSFVFRRLNL